MADITHSTICSNLDAGAGACRLNGLACPFLKTDFALCPDSTFLARVSMPPDEFVIVLSAAREPALGMLSVMKCRSPEYHRGVAGVHLNVVLDSPGDAALLTAAWQMDGTVEYFCPASEVKVGWRKGKFIPM